MKSTQRVPVDLDLALGGYLKAMDGRLRPIEGIDRLAREIVVEGCTLSWEPGLPSGVGGACGLWTGTILLAPWLFDAENWMIRRVIAHELGHNACGYSEDRANEWMRRVCGDSAEPFASFLAVA